MNRGRIEHVRVYVRIRPLKDGEIKDEKCLTVDEKNNSITRKGCENGKNFKFDRIFVETSKQEEIYEVVASPIVESVLSGVNGTIFAYGQTGSGKTYTMAGDDNAMGIIPISFHKIFEKIFNSSQQNAFVVTVTYLEIYNEDIRDLLSCNTQQKLQIHENRTLGPFVKDLSGFTVNSINEIITLFKKGTKNRTTKFTSMNSESSRSHAIFTVAVESKENPSDEIVVGKLNFVDLAGSERLDRTQVTNDRLKETGHINLSLSVLGNVISSLLDKGCAYIPYRNSKLTRLLQDSLGGNSKTAMIATISPADIDTNESICTLRYANRVSNIKNFVTANKKENGLIDAFETQIKDLKQQLQFLEEIENFKNIKLEQSVLKYSANEKVKEEIKSTENEKQELLKKIETLQKRIIIGGENYLEKAEIQNEILQKTISELEFLNNTTTKLEQTLQERSQETTDLKANYSSLQEENEDLDRQIKEIQTRLNESKKDLAEQQSEEQFELERLREDAKVLKKDNGLANLIIENFAPPECYKIVKSNMKWDEKEYDFKINQVAYSGNYVIRKPEGDTLVKKRTVDKLREPYLTSKRNSFN